MGGGLGVGSPARVKARPTPATTGRAIKAAPGLLGLTRGGGTGLPVRLNGGAGPATNGAYAGRPSFACGAPVKAFRKARARRCLVIVTARVGSLGSGPTVNATGPGRPPGAAALMPFKTRAKGGRGGGSTHRPAFTRRVAASGSTSHGRSSKVRPAPGPKGAAKRAETRASSRATKDLSRQGFLRGGASRSSRAVIITTFLPSALGGVFAQRAGSVTAAATSAAATSKRGRSAARRGSTAAATS